MNFVKTYFSRSLLCLAPLIFFAACKKYPKNYLLFQSPDKVLTRGVNKPWLLEYYSVNNIDSTSSVFLKIWREKGLTIGSLIPNNSDAYNCSDMLSGFHEFFDHEKIIVFKYGSFGFLGYSPTNSNYTQQRNIFMNSGLRWKIDKLTNENLWIITESDLNNMKYEIHFK